MESTKDDELFHIYLVSSVKGGCGKTAFSLFQAMKLANDEQLARAESENTGRNASVLFLDADFKGTGTQILIYGKDEAEFKTVNMNCSLNDLQTQFNLSFKMTPTVGSSLIGFRDDYVQYTINDYLTGDINEVEKMIVHGHIYSEVKRMAPEERVKSTENETAVMQPIMNGFLDFIFSSCKAKGKQKFQYGGSLPTVELARYTDDMRCLLATLYGMGDMRNRVGGSADGARQDFGYKHIVIDMPPGDDAYATALLDVIYKWIKIKRKDEVRLHHYLVSTDDRGHIGAMLEEMDNVVRRADQHEVKGQIEITIVLDETNSQEFMREREADVLGRIQKNSRNDIKVIKCPYSNEYYQFCRGDLSHKYAFTGEFQEIGR